ncbi:yemanuclein-like [Cimex lectularius]|uniref:Hpc2-related domain-containing protein n=1 Tax=Cimex lectularius TaxID=79782 RepID=A0A8I6TH08_CIMLE|nr:yemanuclein-like [Cimex lectularius]
MTDKDFRLLEGEKPKNATEKEPKSIRLNLELKNGEEDHCPIFNYYNLIQKRKHDISDGVRDNVDQMDKQRSVSYAQLGAGYDENDSFIDNTDLQDEGMPENLDTKRGGFYVNYGKLEFTKVCDGIHF